MSYVDKSSTFILDFLFSFQDADELAENDKHIQLSFAAEHNWNASSVDGTHGNITVTSITGVGPAALPITIGTASGEDLTVNTTHFVVEGDTGFIGIGVAAPAEHVEIESGAATTCLQISNTAADGDPCLAFALSGTKLLTMGIDDGDNDFFKIGTTAIGTDTKMVIKTSGNPAVGIGGTPSVAFHVFGQSIQLEHVNLPTISINNTVADGEIVTFTSRVNGSSNGALAIGINGQLMSLSETGAIRVGSATTEPSAEFDIETTNDSLALRVDRPGTTTTNPIAEFISNSGGTNTTHCRIMVDGDLENTNNAYGAISDFKLKENIVDCTPKLADILNLKVVNFNFKNNPDFKQIGLIAQDVEKIFPGLIKNNPDYKTDKKNPKKRTKLNTVTKSLKYSVFVPMLIKALQEQNQEIEKLKLLIK